MLTVLRLARTPQATLCGRACGHAWVRSVATEAPQEKAGEEPHESLLAQQVKGKSQRGNIVSSISSQLLKGRQDKERENEEAVPTAAKQQFDEAKEEIDPMRMYDILYSRYPTLRREFDVNKVIRKKEYGDVFLKQQMRQSKQVFKFKDLVAKNYRTLTRSWPMVRLDKFKYGNSHFLDELYDNLPGKYQWNNQLAYPDGTINLFCGTSGKGLPLNVKEDPFATSYDDKLYKADQPDKKLRFTLTKEEADARYPNRAARTETAPSEVAHEQPALAPKKVEARRAEETEEEEQTRLAREEQEAEAERALRRARRKEAREKYFQKWEREKAETKAERAERWRREAEEDRRRPWRTMTEQGRKGDWDDRVVYDPVTMIKVPSMTSKGRLVERYYYRDEITEANTTIYDSSISDEFEPNYGQEPEEVVGLPLDTSSKYENDRIYPNYEPTVQKNSRKLRELISGSAKPAQSGAGSGTGTGAGAGTALEAKEPLGEEGLPAETRAAMKSSFQDLVKEGKLKPEDEASYKAEYIRLIQKAFHRKFTEHEWLTQHPRERMGYTVVDPTYYFRYIKLNLAQGWIRFYVGEQDYATNEERQLLGEQLLYQDKDLNPMETPFYWRYSEYKLSEEDLEKLRAVKWPPSLVPPPQSPFQNGDGSPTDQLAEYFERSYLRFGHNLRFNPDECYDPKFDRLEHPDVKYRRVIDEEPFEERVDLLATPSLVKDMVKLHESQDGLIRTRSGDMTKDDVIKVIGEEVAEHLNDARIDNLRTPIEISNEARPGAIRAAVLDARDGKLPNIPIKKALPDPDDLPERRQAQPPLFRQRGNVVYAYDDANNVTQEYTGYRLKVTRDKVRVVRVSDEAKIRYFKNGLFLYEEWHRGPVHDILHPFRHRSAGNEEDERKSIMREAIQDAIVDLGVRGELVGGEWANKKLEGETEAKAEGPIVDELLAALDGKEETKVEENKEKKE